MTIVAYSTLHRLWSTYVVVMGPDDVPTLDYVVGSCTDQPPRGPVHLVSSGLPRGVREPVSQSQAEQLTGLVGPPALDKLRELVES